MNVSFESRGNFNHLEQWLKEVSKSDPSNALAQIANEGIESLSRNTPRDTGATASGWKAEVTTKGDTSEVSWYNVAHPNASVNVAKIIDQGHGTGTGGYVQPKPYIKESMESVWKTAGDKIAEELIE